MKFTTVLMTLMAATMATAIPIEKRDVPYQITSPAANSTVQVNQNLVITWVKGQDNSPINIGLIAGAEEPLSSSSILVSKGISGSIGTVVYPVSSSLGNGTSAWRVAISHGSDPVQYSSPFYISSDLSQQQAQQQPSFTASVSNATYSAAASISILGPDGQPVPVGGSSMAPSSTQVSFMVYWIIPLVGYMLM